jgi:hypothetical protein
MGKNEFYSGRVSQFCCTLDSQYWRASPAGLQASAPICSVKHRQRRYPLDRLPVSLKEEANMHSTIDRNPAGTALSSSLGLRAFAVATLLLAGVAAAARGGLSEAQARYQLDRAACMSGQSHQDNATCLKEAGAALQEAKSGRTSAGQSSYEQNQLIRCEHLSGGDRDDCLRRMRGEGTVSGSVESGGIYRELRTTVPAK